MNRSAATVKEYLESLPDDRRKALEAVRKVIKQNLDKGFVEGIQYGMIGYFVPHSIYPAGYHCDPKQPLPFAGLASQKNHMSMYLGCVYMDPELESWFKKAWTGAGKKLDMGKACIRFKKLEDVPLDVVGEAISRLPVKNYIASYEKIRDQTAKRPAKKKSSAKKTTAKKKAVKTKAKR